MIRTIFPILALAAASMATAQDDTPAETRRYDIRTLSSALTNHAHVFPFAQPAYRPGGAGEASLRVISCTGADPRDQNADDVVERLVAFALKMDLRGDTQGDAISARDGRLHAAGDASFHRDVTRALSDLAAAIEPMVDVELIILPPEALQAAPHPVLDAAKIERVLAIAKPLAVMRTRVRPGNDAIFEAVARRAFVKDYDTEVAQDSKAFDPLVDVIPEGTRAAVRVDVLPNGAFHITVRGQQCDANGPPRTVTLSVPHAATLQLPKTWWTAHSASARIEDKGALVLGNDAAHRAAWAIRVFAPTARRATDPRLLPIGAALSPPLRDEAPFVVGPMPGGVGATLSPPTESEGADPRASPDLLLEDVHALRPEGVDAGGRRAIIAGRHLALDGSPKFVDAAAALATRVVDEVTSGVAIEIRYGAVPAAGFTVQDADPAALAQALPHRATTAATLGDRVVMAAGETHAYLKDRDIEIAQGASVDDPIVDAFFTGLSLGCRPLPAESGRAVAEVSFDYQELLELLPVANGSPEVLEIELPRLAAVRGHVVLDGPPGTWQLAHTAPLDGTDRQFVLLLRIATP